MTDEGEREYVGVGVCGRERKAEMLKSWNAEEKLKGWNAESYG
jgi:hypothetical protein